MTPRERQDIEGALERFIIDELLDERYDSRDPLTADAVDSLGFEQLVEYIEEEFGVRLSDAEMVKENFESIAVLAALVGSKLEAASA